MKKFIKTKDQELLEKYPILWNTKIIWMLAACLILHILFYLMGMLALLNPESLQEYSAIEVFFKNGAVFISVMISVLLLVVWMISMFRNNSFKNFYPHNNWKLFKQFGSYFIVFLASTTFYYSYTLGVQTYVKAAYSDERMKDDISLVNDTAPFFSLNLGSYELDELDYPYPFDTFYCSSTSVSGNIDYSGKYYEFKGRYYQYYSMKIKVYGADEFIHQDSVQGHISNRVIDGKKVFYYKSEIENLDEHIKTSHPSYYNYSQLFYTNDEEFYDDILDMSSTSIKSANRYDYDNPFQELSSERKLQIQKHQDFLRKEDRAAYQKLFYDFITLVDKYKIKHSLTTDSWIELAYTTSPYEVEGLIHKARSPYVDYDSYDSQSDFEKYEQSMKSEELFLDVESLERSLKNIEEIKEENIFSGSIHLFLWMAFFLSCIVFVFRTTSLKSLLFTIIVSFLLMIIVGLFTALFEFLGGYGNNAEYFFMYAVLVLGGGIMAFSFFGLDKVRKLVGSIFINITLISFIPYLLLILILIETHQNDWCNDLGVSRYDPDDCYTILDSLEMYWSYTLLLIGILFIFLYSKTILKWRSLPEG